MELNHKIYKLIDPNGNPTKIANIGDLKILIEGWDFNIPVVAKKEEDIKFFHDAAKWEDDGFEAFSIFEKFPLDNAGYLVHDGMHLSFLDSISKMELRVQEIVEPPLLMVKFPGTMDIDEETHNVLTVALKRFYSKAIESAEAEAEVEIEAQPEVEPTTLTEQPVTTEPVAIIEPEINTEPVKTEPVTTEPAANTEPVNNDQKTTEPITAEPVTTEPVATTEPAKEEPVTTEPAAEIKPEVVIEGTTSELEQEVIPEEVMKKFEGYKKDLIDDGFEEYDYKNYRVFYKEVADGALDDHGNTKLPHSDVYVLLLTPAGVMEIDRLVICDDESNDEKVKYQFKLKGEKKSAYINRKEGTLVVKKPKKKEEEKA